MDYLNASTPVVTDALRPLESVLFLLGLALTLAGCRRLPSRAWRRVLPAVFALLFYGLYRLAQRAPAAGPWLYRLESPLLPPFLLLVLPALFLPRTRAYRLFLACPALVLAAFAGHVATRLLHLTADAP